jgi:hypothetical protein
MATVKEKAYYGLRFEMSKSHHSFRNILIMEIETRGKYAMIKTQIINTFMGDNVRSNVVVF